MPQKTKTLSQGCLLSMSIRDLELKGKKVLVRVDFNVPLIGKEIADDTRIRAVLPTIRYVLEKGGIPILLSHLGRPNGKIDPNFSLAPCAVRLSEYLEQPVIMAPDCCGEKVLKILKNLKPGSVVLLENLRFHEGEEHPEAEPNFASELADLGEAYINDAFGAAHRSHVSITYLPQFFPEKAVAGLLMEKEVAFLGTKLMHPKRPFCAILGGAKISTKFKMIEALRTRADMLLIGGAMAFTFLKAQKKKIGNSPFESSFMGVANEILSPSKSPECRIFLPVDLIIAKEISPQAEIQCVSVEDGIPEGFQGVDIGPKTVQIYAEEMKKAATIFWNGPLGIFEIPPFAHGTDAIAHLLPQTKAITIVGGGDSLAAIEKAGVADQISHLSTGGGASLEYIEWGTLPGIEALSKNNKK